MVEGYLKSKKLDPLALSFKTNLRTMIKQGEFASNLIAYLLEHNPTIKFEFKSNDPLIVGVARYLKVDSIDSFNSLFKIIATSELSTKVSPRLIELLLGELLVKDRFVFGFKGVELNEAESSGDLSLDPLTLAQQGSLLAGFSSDGGKRLISLRELLISNLLKDKPKLKVVVKGGRSIDITKASLDVADYVFIGTETNKLTLEGNLSYQIKGLLKQADRLFAVVELSDTKGKKPSHPYLVEVVLDPNKTTTQGVFKLATSIQPQVESNSLLLQLIVRLTPALSFDKDGRASFSLDRRLRAPELITWLALLLLDRDSSLLTKAKIYYLNQGFVVKSEEPISRALVDSLGLN